MTKKLSVAIGLGWAVGASCTSSTSTLSRSPATPSTPPASSAPPASSEYRPAIDPSNYVSAIDNPFLPFSPGARWVYRGTKDGETQREEVVVTNQTKVILGVPCLVVRDTATHGGRLLEKTDDWYTQDRDGNVWYFGEDTASYDEHGKVESREGSWEAGVDGAQPGIVMPARPKVTDSFRQEFYRGHAEDTFWIVSVTESVDVPFGSFHDALRTLEWSRLEPEVIDQKDYVAGIGIVLEVAAAGGQERAELVSFTKP
jgi:hypothetical protein